MDVFLKITIQIILPIKYLMPFSYNPPCFALEKLISKYKSQFSIAIFYRQYDLYGNFQKNVHFCKKSLY